MAFVRSLMRTRAALPRAAGAAKQALVPVFSMQSRHMSVPRPAWDKDLKDLDPEVYQIIQKEQQRQHKGIALIPSENYTTHAVSQVFCSRSRCLAQPAPRMRRWHSFLSRRFGRLSSI